MKSELNIERTKIVLNNHFVDTQEENLSLKTLIQIIDMSGNSET